MTEIPFTQYLFPDGRQKKVLIDRPENIAHQAHLLIDEGYRFECENADGEIRLTVVDPDDEYDVAIEIVPNGPDVPVAVDALVNRVFAIREQTDD